jgi:hypothetical protein
LQGARFSTTLAQLDCRFLDFACTISTTLTTIRHLPRLRFTHSGLHGLNYKGWTNGRSAILSLLVLYWLSCPSAFHSSWCSHNHLQIPRPAAMFTRHLTRCGVRSCITPALADARDSHGRLVGYQESWSICYTPVSYLTVI